MAGCHAPEFGFQEEASSPDPISVELNRPLRLQVKIYHGPAKLRFKTILDELRTRGHIVSLGRWGSGVAEVDSADELSGAGSEPSDAKNEDSEAKGEEASAADPEAPSEPAEPDHTSEPAEGEATGSPAGEAPAELAVVDPTLSGEPDYEVQVGLKVVGRPWGFTNFAVTWVFGSMFGAPGWTGMEYTYEVATEIRLIRVGAKVPFLSTTVLDTYRLTYTSEEYAWLIYFWDLGFLSGIVSTWDELADESELGPVETAFFADEALCKQYLRRVMAAIEGAVASDLARSGGS